MRKNKKIYFSMVSILMLSICLVGCKGKQNGKIEDVESVNQELSYHLGLQEGNRYRVLDREEYFYSSFVKKVFLGEYSYEPENRQVLRFIFEDVDTKERVYSVIESKCEEISQQYQHFGCLMEGNVIEFENEDYKLVLDK